MKRDKAAQSDIMLYAVFLIFVIWAALLTAPSMSGGLPEILANLTVAINNPFDIRWVDNTPKYILLFITAYGMGIGIYLSTKHKERGTRQRMLGRHGCCQPEIQA